MSILLVTSRRRAQRVLSAAREAFRFFARCFAATRAFFVLTCFEVIANATTVYRYIFVNNQDGGKLTRSSTEKMRGVEDQSSAVAEQETGTWLSSWFSWCPTSERLLEIAESQILEKVRSYYESEFVPLGNGQKIWTLKFNQSAKRVPLVLVHGFGGGVGLWAMNVDTLAENRTVYAFDVLGFGRSSRPQLSADPDEAEEQFVDSIEQWREKIGLEKFVLLGHSLGGFLASSYAIKYPSRVQHLILADPWGFPVKPTEDNVGRHIPAWVKLLGAVLSPFNPLAGLRAAGPWGPSLVRQFRPDFQRKFSSILSDDTIFNYIYHCNAQVPSGETAFKSMTIPYGWARHPMIYRIGNIDRNIPITMIYGSRSWIDSSSGRQTQERRRGCYVDIQVITGAGHHVYVDKPDKFNEIVEKVCQTEDDGGVGITVDSDSSN